MIALGLLVALGGGWLAFTLEGFSGSFLSLTGLKCVGAVLLVVVVVAIATVKELHDLHSRNPQAHGMARPASEAEAQAAARGKAKPLPVHQQRFED